MRDIPTAVKKEIENPLSITLSIDALEAVDGVEERARKRRRSEPFTPVSEPLTGANSSMHYRQTVFILHTHNRAKEERNAMKIS